MQPLSGDSALEVEFGHITYNTRSGPRVEDIHFVRVPSGSTSQENWVINGVPSGPYATHPPSNLLAVLQIVEEGR